MKFIILFEDDPGAAPDLRQRHMAAHLAFLEAHAGEIDAAGPLSDPDGQGRDGLWVVDVDGPDRAEALIRADPFWPTGLRQSYTILHWTQVYAAGARLIHPKS